MLLTPVSKPHNTAGMFIMTGKGHYQSMPETADAKVSDHSDASSDLDLSGNDMRSTLWQCREDCPRS